MSRAPTTGPFHLWTGTPNELVHVAAGELPQLKKRATTILQRMLPPARKFDPDAVGPINEAISEINGVWMRHIPRGDQLGWRVSYMGIEFVVRISHDTKGM